MDYMGSYGDFGTIFVYMGSYGDLDVSQRVYERVKSENFGRNDSKNV